MQGVTVAHKILDHIVQEGKQLYVDRKVQRQKMPVYSNQRTQAVNCDAIIHSGYQHQTYKRLGCLSMKQEPQPVASSRDHYSQKKGKIEKNKINKSACISPNKQKKRSYSYSGLSKKYKSSGFGSLKVQSNQKEKENQFIKLDEDHKGRVVIDRVQKRQQAEDDMWRIVKQEQMMKKYQEKKANQMFQRQREKIKQQKQKQLKTHTSKGKDHKYYFHEGQVVLYREQQSHKKNFPNKTAYNIKVDDFQANQIIAEQQSKSSRYFRRSQNKSINQQAIVNQHHRIKSARGEVFASSVLKTINLSRISLNETLRNLQVDQFMKRNDLFNNNHSRQTSSIPYMLAKSGTVYTQLSTNQVLADGKGQEDDKESCSFKSDTTRHPRTARRKSHFEPYWHRDSSVNNITERAFQEQNRQGEDHEREPSRTIKTAEGNNKRIYSKQRRPHTSVSRGRITTANQGLAVVLLE